MNINELGVTRALGLQAMDEPGAHLPLTHKRPNDLYRTYHSIQSWLVKKGIPLLDDYNPKYIKGFFNPRTNHEATGLCVSHTAHMRIMNQVMPINQLLTMTRVDSLLGSALPRYFQWTKWIYTIYIYMHAYNCVYI